jgi:hypothetical protein
VVVANLLHCIGKFAPGFRVSDCVHGESLGSCVVQLEVQYQLAHNNAMNFAPRTSCVPPDLRFAAAGYRNR